MIQYKYKCPDCSVTITVNGAPFEDEFLLAVDRHQKFHKPNMHMVPMMYDNGA